ncbi:helix-turn-helix domain-containing protein [Glaesserella parasuis]|uniref:helix-turn-helix domain-containing protein n=1 Tax=Glaesserella parasuis TaxID=738 RepID=UPI003C6EEE6D
MMNLTPTLEKHYTIKELNELLGFSRSKIDKLAKAGKLHKIKVGQTVLFSASEINRFLSECSQNDKN